MRQIACGLLAAGLIATTATAEAQELGSATFLTQARSVAATLAPTGTLARTQTAAAPAPAPKKVTGLVGADMPMMTGYVFRGIVQEVDPGFTFQPFVDVGVAVSDTLTLNFGTWNNFGALQSLITNAVCKARDERIMPNAEVTLNQFWRSDARAQYVSRMNASGCGLE
jgi:hypothetical protein